MKNQLHDTRLSINPYLKALDAVETQFALIRFALNKLSKGQIQGFYKARLNAQLTTISTSLDNAREWVALTFSAGDLVDLRSLASKLKQPTDAVSTYLKNQLSATTLIALAKYQGSGSDPVPLQKTLVEDINRIIRSRSIYETQRFADGSLRSETQQLLAQNPQGDALLRLNRLLLEDAYPQEISRSEEWESTKEDALEYKKKMHKKDNRPADTRFKIEMSEDRINQSELLLLVAHFESFMKEVHQTFLTAAPAKVFSKRDTKFMLRELFAPETGSSFSKFLNELIIKEVKRLDKENIEAMAGYFFEHFGIGFGTKEEIDDLKEIMVTRNKISHEIYSTPPRTLEQIKDQPLVSDAMLKRARNLFKSVPRKCVEVGAKTYQSHFR